MGKSLSCTKKRMDMTDDGFKITLRMGIEEAQSLDDFVSERDLNRSEFIREAIKRYMEMYDTPIAQTASESGIFIRFSNLHMDALG